MRFLTPLYLFGGALIALPIVLHWLRRDVAPEVPFTAVRLLTHTPIDRSRRRRLRDLLLLAARVLALLLLASSFARPYIVGARTASRSTVVAIDRSFSMTAPGRMERARELARQAIADASSAGDRIAVMAFDQRADVVAPFGTPADARLAIDQIQPGSGATRYAAAFDRAAELLSDEARGRLVIVSDLQRSGFDGDVATLPDSVELVVRDAGTTAGNVAVTDVRVEPRRLVATVRNFGSAARTVAVRAETGGHTLASKQIALQPEASSDVAFEGVTPAGQFDVAIDDKDGYAADNVRYGYAANRSLPRVLIVTGSAGSGHGFYFSKALQAATDDGPDFDVRLVTGSSFAAMSAAEIGQQSVIVLLSTHGIDRRVRDTLKSFLAAGHGLFIAAGPDVDSSVLSTLMDWTPELDAKERNASSVLAATDLRHPIFRPFTAMAANLGQVSVEHLWQVDAGSNWRVVARYTDGDAALLERVGGRILLFTSDVDRHWNNFPVHTAFVPFVQESVRYLGADSGGPSGVIPDASASTAKPGFYQVADRTMVLNVDIRESATERVAAADFPKLVPRTANDPQPARERAGQQAEARQNYWQYGLILMLGALVAESFVGARY
jgi:hypothetical protein